MLTEGSISIGRSNIDRLGASSQAASLSSSSSSTPTKAEKTEAEGTALAVGQTEQDVTVVLSSDGLQAGAAESGTGVVNNNQPDKSGVRNADQDADGGRSTVESGVDTSGLAQQAEERGKERLDRISEEINSQLSDQLKLRFRTDEETGLDLFQLVEQDTGEVVRQIPSEEVLSFMRRFQENSPGLLVSEQA